MQGVSTSVQGACLTIDFSGSGLNLETLQERASEVLPLLHALLSADTVLSRLDVDTLEKRGRGFLAIDMMCQGAIHEACGQAELLMDIATGTASVAHHGFPEFADGRSLDV